MNQRLLILNAGSSSIKFALFGVDDLTQPRLEGLLSGLGSSATAGFEARDGTGARLTAALPSHHMSHDGALEWLFAWLGEHRDGTLIGAGHRVVHGGEYFAEPVLITAKVADELEKLVPLAPLHQPHNLAAIRALIRLRPTLPQVACFDTAFHRTQDVLAKQFALPREFTTSGIQRYGFHGLSYEYIAGVLPDHLGARATGRVIVAHLGNGASLCAMRNRRCVATTMGFTALDGLMMGTRCGAIDPGVLLYLMREKALSADAIEDLLYRRSGLLGVSGVSSDMRGLLASDDANAQEAIALFCYRVVREIGSLMAALGGLDALVFTAGIGERAHPIRAQVCAGLGWLGVALDAAANQQHAGSIHAPQSTIGVHVIPTNEEAVIARHAVRLLNT